MVAAEVDWTDEVTDPAGDVEDTEGTAYPDRGDVDILSVSIVEDGDDINVTMVIGDEYNSSGSYSISISADGGDDTYDFMRMMFLGFSVSDPTGATVDVDGYYSEDGTMLSWVVAKADIVATEELEIEMAMTMVMDITGGGPTLMDYAGFAIPSDIPVPGGMDLVLRFPKLNVLEMKVTMTYKGENASNFRMLIDEDADGTVSDAELTDFMDEMGEPDPADPAEANVTYDGKDPTDLDSEYSIEGGKGAVDSTADVDIIVTMSVTFPKAEDKDTHEIVFKDPFGEDFIGGDEPWENEFDMTLKFQAPDGWTFKGGSLPAKMKDYLNKDGDEVTMEGEEIREDWNNTFANLRSFEIEKGGDDNPGFGLVVAIAAVAIAVVAVNRRRR
jgi:hypothetical protein